MSGRDDLAGLVTGALVTWRVSHLLVAEDGPGHVLTRARAAIDTTPLFGLLDCFGCTSVWVGALTSLAVRRQRSRTVDAVLAGLAMSGAAFCLQKVIERIESPGWQPEPEVDSPLVQVHP